MWNGMPRAAAREQTWKSEQMKLVFTRQMAMNEALQVLFTAGHELGVQPWQPLHTLTPLSRHHTKYGIWICVTALCTLQNAAICFQAKLQNRCCHLCGDRSCFSCGRSKAFKSIELSFDTWTAVCKQTWAGLLTLAKVPSASSRKGGPISSPMTIQQQLH